MLPHTKNTFRANLARHYLLRVHMTFILGGTFAGGLLANTALRHIDALALRYSVAVVAGYLVFLLLIRLWLFYIRYGGIDISADGIELGGDVAQAGAESLGGGGNFGGGGASGSWGGDASAMPLRSANVASPRSGDGSSFDFDLGFDADEWVVVVLLIALVAALLFSTVYVVWTAPTILADTAFEAFLVAALARRARKIDSPGWVGTVWRATFWPFVAVLVLAAALGFWVQESCPEATKLRDAFRCGDSGLISSPRHDR